MQYSCIISRLGKGIHSLNELAGVCSVAVESIFVFIAVQNSGRVDSEREMCFKP